MTTVQPPRHRAPAGTREPHPSGPVVSLRPVGTEDASVEPPTAPISRAALHAAAGMRGAPAGPVAAPAMPPAMPSAMPRPAGHAAPVAMPVAAPRNGLGIAGLVLGLCGLVVGLIPLLGMGAILLGVVGLVLGLVGVARARRGAATNTGTAVTGVVACVLAVALGIWGLVIVANAFTELDRDLSAIGATTPAASAPAAPAAPATTAVGFGQTFTYADGLAVSVSEPASYDPSRYAAGNSNPYAYSVTVRITNNTGAAFDPVLLQAAMSTGGAPASQIFDAETGTPPQNQLQPGRTMTYEVAFSTTTNSGEAQVDITPSFDHEPAVFTGTL
ncbi:hypothetical protein [Actinomycetospora straminea]|uniref:DUF4352 domain-containing protein n=1 Tax=Actinomycetospora straminea TaxID=663607 RepID=A0ABP9ERZ9_9PSEU|nr:hypothetical protein [Actinomycetospora straminea]MDD7934023.1 hypothetical protein [Actinomycetospora straminea]